MIRIGCPLAMLALLAWSPAPFAQSVDAQAQDPVSGEATASSPPKRSKPPAEIVFPSSVGDVLFPHRAHLKMKCAKCHHQIHAEPLDTPHEDYLDSTWINCQTCHSTESIHPGKYYKCSDCHHATPQNISDETLSSKVVIHKSCWACHRTGTGVDASQACGECHVKNGGSAPDLLETAERP
jgi:hypothetical protein